MLTTRQEIGGCFGAFVRAVGQLLDGGIERCFATFFHGKRCDKFRERLVFDR